MPSPSRSTDISVEGVVGCRGSAFSRVLDWWQAWGTWPKSWLVPSIPCFPSSPWRKVLSWRWREAACLESLARRCCFLSCTYLVLVLFVPLFGGINQHVAVAQFVYEEQGCGACVAFAERAVLGRNAINFQSAARKISKMFAARKKIITFASVKPWGPYRGSHRQSKNRQLWHSHSPFIFTLIFTLLSKRSGTSYAIRNNMIQAFYNPASVKERDFLLKQTVWK